MTKEKKFGWITVQVAAVKKMLGSVSKNNAFGQRVVYDSDCSYIEDEKSREKLNLRSNRGVFILDAWIVP